MSNVNISVCNVLICPTHRQSICQHDHCFGISALFERSISKIIDCSSLLTMLAVSVAQDVASVDRALQ